MRCPTCEQAYPDEMEFCSGDGTRLVPDAQGGGGDPLIGAVLHGRYRIIEPIGSGGMGTVYRAKQVNIDRDVAVKLLTEDASRKEDVVRRFENEARIISRLRHPNTLKLIDFGRTGQGKLFLVTEFLTGQPLDAALAEGPLGAARTLHVLSQTCDSLIEAHEQGVVHRDLKPGNLFVEQVGTQEVVKVLDFGIAKVHQSASHTATGMVFGTPAYMSPEQARGEKVDSRSDLYSLGIIAYECLSGHPPFEAETPVSLLLKHLSDEPVPLRDLEPPISVIPAVDETVLWMLDKDPTRRVQSAAELREEVTRLQWLVAEDESADDISSSGRIPRLTPPGPTRRVTPSGPRPATRTPIPGSAAAATVPDDLGYADTIGSTSVDDVLPGPVTSMELRMRRRWVPAAAVGVAVAALLAGAAAWLLLGRGPADTTGSAAAAHATPNASRRPGAAAEPEASLPPTTATGAEAPPVPAPAGVASAEEAQGQAPSGQAVPEAEAATGTGAGVEDAKEGDAAGASRSREHHESADRPRKRRRQRSQPSPLRPSPEVRTVKRTAPAAAAAASDERAAPKVKPPPGFLDVRFKGDE